MSQRRQKGRSSARLRARKVVHTPTAPEKDTVTAGLEPRATEPQVLTDLLPPLVRSSSDEPAPGSSTVPVGAPATAEVRDTQLIVKVTDSLYALPISSIEEILPMKDVAPLPRSAAAVRGVLFLRGHAVTVVDMGILLGAAPARGGRIVVVVIEGERYGMVVDQVLKVLPADELEGLSAPASALGASQAVCAVARVAEQVVSLIDLERLVPAGAAADPAS
ncbi:MAG: chemotaxis protein CheW [Acidobacteriota bacterium]